MKMKTLFFLAFLLSINICIYGQYNSETDFEVIINSDNKSITIIKYIGTRQNVNIPVNINRLPVTVIGNGAFKEKQLTSVIIPNNVTIIGSDAFSSNQLTSVTIPNNVAMIGSAAFYNNQLTSVTIPNSITIIGAFTFCRNRLTSIVIPNNVTIIQDSAFRSNQLTSVIIPDSVKVIDIYAFASNKLTDVIISNNVTKIGYRAFECNHLTNIIIPNNVSIIEEEAFAENQLINITIGENVSLANGRSRTPAVRLRSDSFDNNFPDFYNRNNKRAGVYILSDNQWNMSGKDDSSPFIGTWTGNVLDENVTVVVTEKNWTASIFGYGTWGSGSYTYNGNTATVVEDANTLGTAVVSRNTMTVNAVGLGIFTLSK